MRQLAIATRRKKNGGKNVKIRYAAVQESGRDPSRPNEKAWGGPPNRNIDGLRPSKVAGCRSAQSPPPTLNLKFAQK